MAMKFFTRIEERLPHDAQEHAALLKHRLSAIQYYLEALKSEIADYAFFLEGGHQAIVMYSVDSLERLDWIIKRDPHFAYAAMSTIPVVSTEALVREAQDYLGEAIISESDLLKLTFPKKPINENAEYWFAWKEVPPFSPLLPVADQDDVHRRTVLSQEAHLDSTEFADHNPVGKAVGILIAEGNLASVTSHVESCAVFPDTVVTYSRLLTLEKARAFTLSELSRLGRPAPPNLESSP
jgi:hypothetical protein